MRRIVVTAACLILLLTGCGDSPPAAEPTAEPTAQPTTPTATTPAPTGTGTTGSPTASPSVTETATGTPAPTASEDPSGATEITAFFARDTSWVEPETHPLDEPTVGVARAAMELMAAGGTTDPGLQTLVPEGTEVLGADIDGSTLIVDMSEAVRSGQFGAESEATLAQQFAHTGTQFDGIEGVQVLVEGQVVDSLYGHVDWSRPLTPDEFALSPVDVQTPEWGSQVEAGEVAVTGEANTFEANVLLQLIAPDGTEGEQEFTTATCGTGCRGTWSHTFTLDQSGTWIVEAAESDPSDGEGRAPLVVRHELVVP